MQSMPTIPVLLISAFFLIGGVSHFTSTEFFTAIMPDYLSHHWHLVIISGVFEILGAIGLLIAKTRKFAAYGLMALCIAVFPANLNMALNSDQFRSIPVYVLYLRLPLQALLIWFIWWATQAKKRY